MNRKYIFLDIDGTLYSVAQGGIPASAEQAIFAARHNGHKIFLCTGRSLAEIVSYLDYKCDGFIMGAGAMVYAERKRIFDHPIPPDDVTEFRQLLDGMGLGYSLEGSAGAYCSPAGYEKLLWYFSGGSKDRSVQIANAEKNCTYPVSYGDEASDHIYKICAFGDSWEPKYPELEKRLKKPYILTQSMNLPDDHFCIGEITNGMINKGTGIGHVLSYYGGSVEDTIGIGDSSNDIPMFRAVHHAIAMGNATPVTKEAADWVTADIGSHGILIAFLHENLITVEQYDEILEALARQEGSQK